jgi:hypothetical protein
MNTIVFSRDRAMQLDAMLTTIEKYFPAAFINVWIVYTFSDESFGKGYERLMNKYTRGVRWVLEENFRNQVLSLISNSSEYTMFSPDDCIMFGHANFIGLADNVLCHSLRLGRNTTICYPISQPQKIPDGFPKWEYSGADGDFSYPFSTDAHIFRTSDLLEVLRERDWRSVNTMEAAMSGAKSKRLYMTAQERSVYVSIPHNRIQNDFPNRNELGSARDLNDLFLEGKHIDPFHMDFSKVNAAHCPIPFVIV